MEMTNCSKNPEISKETVGPDNMPNPSVLTPEIRAILAPRQYGMFSIFTLLCIALSPLLSMIVFILIFHNIFASMLFMHWFCMCICPIIFLLSHHNGTLYYTYFWKHNKQRFKKQLLWSISSIFVVTIVVLTAYFFFFHILAVYTPEFLRSYIGSVKQAGIENGMHRPFPVLIALGIYFVIWNPIIEEFFWRIFLYKEIGGLLWRHEVYRVDGIPLIINSKDQDHMDIENKIMDAEIFTEHSTIEIIPNSYGSNGVMYDDDSNHLYNSNNNSSNQLYNSNNSNHVYNSNSSNHLYNSNSSNQLYNNNTNQYLESHNTVRHSKYIDIDIGVYGNVVVSLFYMSYHSIVFYQLAGAISVIPSIIILSVLGYIFIYVRNALRFGILTAIGMHLGVDLAVILVYGNILGLI